MKIQKVIAGLVLVMGMSAVGAQAQSGKLAPDVRRATNGKAYTAACGPKYLRAVTSFDRKQDDATSERAAEAAEGCLEFAYSLIESAEAVIAATSPEGQEPGEDFEDEGAPLTAAATRKLKSASTKESTSTPTL
jgi:hypothetical protein